jgi:peptide methionine sulfoxide reductase MsrA
MFYGCARKIFSEQKFTFAIDNLLAGCTIRKMNKKIRLVIYLTQEEQAAAQAQALKTGVKSSSMLTANLLRERLQTQGVTVYAIYRNSVCLYVGQTCNPWVRFLAHRRRFGEDCAFRVLRFCQDEQEANDLEKAFFSVLDPTENEREHFRVGRYCRKRS